MFVFVNLALLHESSIGQLGQVEDSLVECLLYTLYSLKACSTDIDPVLSDSCMLYVLVDMARGRARGGSYRMSHRGSNSGCKPLNEVSCETLALAL